MGIQTDKILKDIKNGAITDASINAIDSIDESRIRTQIANDIDAAFPSRSQFSAACGIHGSQLSEFFNGRKKFGRDNLLTIFITLHYDCDKIQDTLKYLGETMLYARNKRDCHIIKAIHDQKSLEETDRFLMTDGYDPISPDAKELYRGESKYGNGKQH
ncbi:hypothetical protein C809_04016 [Lachnospiraceae bacterium MD335]|jgi:hypothetical protein|nr:hypothetical protein C809_04016 [Lachnospiraceae bacterium MD335]